MSHICALGSTYGINNVVFFGEVSDELRRVEYGVRFSMQDGDLSDFRFRLKAYGPIKYIPIKVTDRGTNYTGTYMFAFEKGLESGDMVTLYCGDRLEEID